jgi:hypothetical protein
MRKPTLTDTLSVIAAKGEPSFLQVPVPSLARGTEPFFR